MIGTSAWWLSQDQSSRGVSSYPRRHSKVQTDIHRRQLDSRDSARVLGMESHSSLYRARPSRSTSDLRRTYDEHYQPSPTLKAQLLASKRPRVTESSSPGIVAGCGAEREPGRVLFARDCSTTENAASLIHESAAQSLGRCDIGRRQSHRRQMRLDTARRSLEGRLWGDCRPAAGETAPIYLSTRSSQGPPRSPIRARLAPLPDPSWKRRRQEAFSSLQVCTTNMEYRYAAKPRWSPEPLTA